MFRMLSILDRLPVWGSEDAGLDIITLNYFPHPHFNTAHFLSDPKKDSRVNSSFQRSSVGAFGDQGDLFEGIP